MAGNGKGKFKISMKMQVVPKNNQELGNPNFHLLHKKKDKKC